jgi:glucosyl-3-phosphoglycerate phosphatase
VTGRRLVLLRHGRTSWNETGRAQGYTDVDLDDRGHAQAAAVAAHLAAMRPAAIWTSDLARARQTAGYVERASGRSATVDPRLREYDVGARQGMTAEQFQAAYPDAFTAWRAGDDLVHVPGAETRAEVEARIVPALRECLASLSPGETGLVVTHGACLKVGLLGLLGWPQTQAADLRGVDNCCWVTVQEGTPGGVRLVGYNQRVEPSLTGSSTADQRSRPIRQP